MEQEVKIESSNSSESCPMRFVSSCVASLPSDSDFQGQSADGNDSELSSEDIRRLLQNFHIGDRIHAELKRQGRSVTWLAHQLNMERTNLYYLFKNSNIKLDTLSQISVLLNHNFIMDISEVVDSLMRHTNSIR